MNILFITTDANLCVWPQYAWKGQRRTWGWFFHFTRDETQVLRLTKQAPFPVEPFHQSANMFLFLNAEFLFNIQYWKKKNWLHLYDNLEIFSQICFSKYSKIVQAGIIIPIQKLRPRIEGSKWNDVCSLVKLHWLSFASCQSVSFYCTELALWQVDCQSLGENDL